MSSRSRSLLKRLDRLQNPSKEMVLTGLTGSEKHRLLILYDGFQSEELTEAEEQEFNALREKVRIVPAYEIITEAEEGASYQQSQRRYEIESAFNQAFHQYAKQFPEVLELPNRYANNFDHTIWIEAVDCLQNTAGLSASATAPLFSLWIYGQRRIRFSSSIFLDTLGLTTLPALHRDRHPSIMIENGP